MEYLFTFLVFFGALYLFARLRDSRSRSRDRQAKKRPDTAPVPRPASRPITAPVTNPASLPDNPLVRAAREQAVRNEAAAKLKRIEQARIRADNQERQAYQERRRQQEAEALAASLASFRRDLEYFCTTLESLGYGNRLEDGVVIWEDKFEDFEEIKEGPSDERVVVGKRFTGCTVYEIRIFTGLRLEHETRTLDRNKASIPGPWDKIRPRTIEEAHKLKDQISENLVAYLAKLLPPTS